MCELWGRIGLHLMEDHQYNNILNHTQKMIWERDHWNGVVDVQGKRCMY